MKTLRDPAKENVSESHLTLPLKDVDLSAVRVDSDAFMAETPAAVVIVAVRAAVGQTILSSGTHGDHGSGGAMLHVKDPASGERLAKAVQRAAVLCGAKSVF